jgi:urease accessory protein
MNRKMAGSTMAALVLAAQGAAASAHVSAEHLSGGLAAGFLHPLTGLDHLAAALMTGLIAARLRAAAVVFLVTLGIGMAAGAAIGTVGFAETVILLSLPMLATILLFGWRLVPIHVLPLLALFAFAHGYAHGSEIEAGTSGLSFAIGALAANTLLVAAGMAAARLAGRDRRLLAR